MINRFALSFLCIELDRNVRFGVTLLYILLASVLGWVSRSQIVSQNLRSICDKHTIKLRLEKRVTGKDRKALVIHTHAQRTRSIYDDIPTLRVPDGSRRMLTVYERNQR